jgi:NAD(P)-dependent dehydrogenase (short-subunit alcohol dehydrogenase family)
MTEPTKTEATKTDATQRFRLDGRVALVTGASSGIGAHLARVLADAGAHVALAARRTDRLDGLATEIRAGGGIAHPIACDVTDRGSVIAAFDAAEQAFGPVDIVLNNAGVPSGSWIAKTSEAEWRAVMAVNLDGVFRVAQEAAQRMQAHKSGGSIINTASILGIGVMRTLAPYATTKAAVIQLTRAMALELARDHIRVNAIAPGYVSTEINSDFLAGPDGQKLLAKVPMGRAGVLDELAGPVLLLASDAGRYMTGSIITVDGGTLLGMG